MSSLLPVGRGFFAVALIASGMQQILSRTFVRLVPGFPAWIPAPAVWAVLSGIALVAAGVAILGDGQLRRGALAAGALLLLLFLALYVPQIVGNPRTGYIWTNPLKTLAMLGGALLLAGLGEPDAAPGVSARRLGLVRLRSAAWIFLGTFLAACGAQHFIYADFVDTLVPGWIPPTQRFWTLFAGTCLVAGGVGLAIPATRRMAGALAGVMVFLWILLLHLPRAISFWSAFELDGVFEATAICGVCLMVAGTAWRAGRRRNGSAAVPASSGIPMHSC